MIETLLDGNANMIMLKKMAFDIINQFKIVNYF